MNDNDMVKVTINGEEKLYKKGIPFQVIADEHQNRYKYKIVLAVVNGKLEELFKYLRSDCELSFITIADKAGNDTYRRSLICLFLKALYDVEEKENIGDAVVRFSISNGYYCEFDKIKDVSLELVNKIKARMFELVKEDAIFTKKSMRLIDAVSKFARNNQTDKSLLFKCRRVSRVNLYDLEGYEDYFYGYMVPSTGYLKYFDLIKYEEGVVLLYPKMSNPEVIEKFEPSVNLFNIQKKNIDICKEMVITNVGELNKNICDGSIKDLILVCEALQEKQIADIAADIVKTGDRKFVMIAGPSSSGKTTFSNRLSIQLLAQGMRPHPIALDNYYLNREDSPRDEDGNFNFECLEAIDIEQFNKDMSALLKGEEVELPVFNFKTGLREYRGDYLKLGEDDILVIEGIHGLNDKLSYSLPKESKYKVYISALTQMNVDNHNRISVNTVRLIRRIVRDARTRGFKAKETIAMWNSVRNGEEKYIFPFQDEANAMFNSALIYELAVLKQYVEPQLFAISKDEPEYIEANKILKLLDYILPVPSEDITNNSILREFIGGSCFNV